MPVEDMSLCNEDRGILQSMLNLREGETPFPWQCKLLAMFRRGEIPDALDIPTGLGKTSVMAIWLAAKILGGPVPRRLVYVVDRRAVVDQATEVAVGLRDWLESQPDHKAKIGLDDRPLPISTLRGQYVDNREWLEDPSAPAIIVGTVDMIGSRLLFEGYGVSRKMRPYHAGLLGVDTLLVLDEAHLVPPFEHLVRAIETMPCFRPRDPLCDQVIPRFKLLSLSATGSMHCLKAHGLTDEDSSHVTVRKRLNAKKALRLHYLKGDDKLEQVLAKEAWAISEDGKKPVRVLVYSDSREVAQKACEAIQKIAKGDKKAGRPAVKIQTELFVGGRRVFEREQAKKRLEQLGFIASAKAERACPTFLFATSAGEVGVDLDADHMVCDLVAWERMVQRLGRVNRRGEPEDHVAKVTVLVPPKPEPDKKTSEAISKRERNEPLDKKEKQRIEKYDQKVQEWEKRQLPLKELAQLADDSLDCSVSVLVQLRERARQDPDLRKILTEASSPEPLRPALTLPLVEAWSLTALRKHPGRPAVQPWLRGWVDDPPQTAIVWRTHLPARNGGRAPSSGEIEAFFEAAPPHTSEILETETFRATDWILARVEKIAKQLADGETSGQEVRLRDEDVVAFAFDPDGTHRKDFRLGYLRSLENKDEFKETLSGGLLIVDARIGGLKDGLLDAGVSDPPPTADGSEWLGEGVVGFRIRSIEVSTPSPRDPNWRERFRFVCEVSGEGEPNRWLIVDKWRDDAATEDDRSEGLLQLLEEHQKRAEQRARKLAETLGLSEALANLLALAARFHDEGKRALRWQRAFNAPKDGVYAKTEGPINQGLLDGYRHELGSVLRVEKHACVDALKEEDRDFVLHLIAAHHGFARPVIGTGGCEDAPPSLLEEKTTEIALRFARLQKRWGPWGLAWWETLLRAADQLASRDTAAGSNAEGGM